MTRPPEAGTLTLHLLRHAKSSWDDPRQGDRDRPLAPRGERAARKLAHALGREGVAPGLVLCSSARRALETLELIRPALPRQAEILVEEALYGAGGRELMARLRRLPAECAEVMLIGHNPGIHDLALTLAGGGAPGPLREHLPTGALVSLRCAIAGWSRLRPGDGEVTRFLVPRRL
ncbi:MAG: SixA phosphatase family protein [Candidatus Dormibacteria bacterium]